MPDKQLIRILLLSITLGITMFHCIDSYQKLRLCLAVVVFASNIPPAIGAEPEQVKIRTLSVFAGYSSIEISKKDLRVDNERLSITLPYTSRVKKDVGIVLEESIDLEFEIPMSPPFDFKCKLKSSGDVNYLMYIPMQDGRMLNLHAFAIRKSSGVLTENQLRASDGHDVHLAIELNGLAISRLNGEVMARKQFKPEALPKTVRIQLELRQHEPCDILLESASFRTYMH